MPSSPAPLRWKKIQTADIVMTSAVRSSSDTKSLDTESYDSIPLIENSQPFRPERRLLDVLLCFAVLLFAESARGIVLPTLSHFVTSLGGSTVMYGYAVAGFSLGRFASTIGLGYLSAHVSYKTVLQGSVLVCVVGNFLYGLAGSFGGEYLLLVSRVLTGIGAGTLSVARAYTAHVTTPEERTRYMSYLGAVQFFGFAITPALGSVLVLIPDFRVGVLRVGDYTYPGYFLMFCNALLLAGFFKFQNPPEKSATAQKRKSIGGDAPAPIPRSRVYLLFGIFLALNFLVRLVLGIIETLATPMYIKVNGGDESKGTEAGFVFGALGLGGMFVLFAISYISKFLSDLQVLISGLVILLVGSGIMIGDEVGLVRFLFGAGLIWCIGYPLAQTLVVSMFSKLLGPIPQGPYMGWIGAMGSLGRIVGPVAAGWLGSFSNVWPMVFCTMCAGLSLVCVLPLIERNKSKPSELSDV